MNSQNVPLSIDSSSSEDLDDLCIDHELVDLDISVAPRKPHFLDYDAVPPPGFEDGTTIDQTKPASLTGCPGESVKIDKKYERDGEISDYELAASGVTKKELTPQRNLSHDNEKNTGARRKKHFLDENPIPPDYMLEREHRSLDRNFERQQEYDSLRYERKHSLDREVRPRKVKDPGYTLSRFIEGDIGPPCRGTWPVDKPSDNSINYSSMPPDNMTNLGPKVECVYSLLSMLGSHDSVEMSKKFLELSRTTETCATLRRSGCIPLLVQMMHSDGDDGVRKRAAMALHNVVHCHPDDKAGRREAKVLRLIEQIMDYCNFLKTLLMSGGEAIADDSDRHPLAAISSLMKVSFDEEHRHAMCQLGALQAIASLVHLDHAVHGPKPEDQCCNSLRRYALMALTNLTFGDGNNKALLCANKEFMEALVAQLDSAPDDLLQVTASVLRNLSWRADSNMKAVLNEIGTVTALAKAAMKNKNENTLKAILSALWNLSAHCSTNKAEFCAVDGALAFLVDMLTYEGPSKTLKIIENAGGILRNVSSHIAVREDYRKILRQRNCLAILLQQLKSESLTVVSNACGTLWNLSARFPEDQKFLWDNGAVPMLRSLIHSKHKMISEGSSAALKNLLNFRPGNLNQNCLDPITKSLGLKELPTLTARKQKAFEQELNQNLSETCDNLDAVTPPKEKKEFAVSSNDTEKHNTSATRLTRSAVISKSESRDSIVSIKSDSVYEKMRRGHSAPPSHDADSKGIGKPINSFNLRNNFVVQTRFDAEQESEQPIDYSAKYNIESATAPKIPETAKTVRKNDSRNYSVYQETDLDQPTDFSLRYAENQTESDSEDKATGNTGSEIILIMEDTVKCYQTEDTPYVISNAASDTDLRNPKPEEQPIPRKRLPQKAEIANVYGSGTYTPEKPINYCEEGTPGYFSRYDSLSSLDESPQGTTAIKAKPEVVAEEISLEQDAEKEAELVNKIQTPIIDKQKSLAISSTPQTPGSNPATGPAGIAKNISLLNSAQETPLMFSRRSSMDSLASAEPVTADDKSSVVSDFSRLASGVISPSDLPDSPTQSMPQSPRRNSNNNAALFPTAPQPTAAPRTIPQPRLRSVFEDDLNTFQVENTPAQFSCATSLSNLSLDDEPKIATDSLSKEMSLLDPSLKDKSPPGNDSEPRNNEKASGSCAYSEGEEETNDDLLLATCINIGMNRGASSSKLSSHDNHQDKKIEPANVQNKNVPLVEDAVKQYYTEDTPALLSKVGSNSNLSALSMSINKGEIINLSDESSNASDGGIELLEQCIREGMQKPTSSKQKTPGMKAPQPAEPPLPPKPLVNDPIAMLRRGGLPPYLPVRDEMNKFIVEGSPCNFSVISGLSNLTVGSNVAGPVNFRKISGPPNEKLLETEGNPESRHVAEDSLSSISIESEDDTNLLSQAIAAGCNKPKPHARNPANVPVPSSSRRIEHTIGQFEPNDSLSSVDSSDSNDNQAKSLFEQCIRTGMNKQKKLERVQPKPTLSPKRSQLPTLALNSNVKTPLKLDRERQRERERKDEQLLRECINTGIAKNTRIETQIKPPMRNVRQVLGQNDPNQRLVTGGVSLPQSSASKNGETTSVAVLEQRRQLETITSQGAPNTAPGVGMRESPDGTSSELRNHLTRLDHHQIENIQNITGSEILKMSQGSLNLSFDGVLDQSNEYPALKLSNIDYNEDSVNESSFEMEVSNEFLIDRDGSEIDISFSQKVIHDKHKDPDLMLKSVERLTQELVSTAEYLRTNGSNNSEIDAHDFDSNNTMFEKKSGSNSNSNNTWNEDTCPNDVSFPSVSITAPMIASLNDDEATISDLYVSQVERVSELAEMTPTNEKNPFPTVNFNVFNTDEVVDHIQAPESLNSQPDSLETETDTLVNDETDGSASSSINKSSTSSGILFKVGGEVQQRFSTNLNQFQTSGPMSFDASSTMTTSTIIAMEANKLAQDLMKNMTSSTTSLDLDNIRPPSCMETLSISGCFDIPQSPQLSRTRKKSLPAGLMARRALAGGQNCIMSGSMESVNSSCNLDNIKPPSLMDELLDSMISVDSITSEIVDNSLGTQTNYETAFSDVDENTTTLQSCMDVLLPADSDSNGTPIPSDFSSAESTPRKGRSSSNNINGIKRALTPKQKRRLIKDRYKTYTIAADFVLKENFTEDNQNTSDYVEDDEIIKIEIEHDEEPKRLTPQQRRQGDRSRFQTQAINLEHINTKLEIDDTNQTSVKRRNVDPDRYKTRTIVYNGTAGGVSNSQIPADIVEQESLTSTEDDSEEMSSIRALTKQFKFITEPDKPPETQQRRTIPISPLIRTKLFDDETRTTTESDYNSMECDQNSETESCDQNAYRTDDEYSPRKIPKPRIIKPGDKDSGTEGGNFSEDGMTPPEAVKVVRGKKKPAYVSPYKKSVVSGSNSRTTSPSKLQMNGASARANLAAKNTNVDSKKNVNIKLIPRNQNIVSKTHVLINKANFTNKINAVKSGLARPGFVSATRKNVVAEKNLINKKLNGEVKPKSIPKPAEASSVEVPVLERQGTFVKDEPSIAEVPVVISLPPSPAKVSKLPTKFSASPRPSNIPKSPAKSSITSKFRLPIQKSSTSDMANKVQPKSSLLAARPRTAGSTTALDSSKRKTFIGVKKSPSVPTVPQRSNSNASLRSPVIAAIRGDLPSTTPPSRSNSNLTSVRPNIGSRIAGIWKKTDDSKKTSGQATASKVATAGKPPSGSSSSSKLVRSSTFDNSPPEPQAQARRVVGPSTAGAAAHNRFKRNVPDASSATKKTSKIGTLINVEPAAS